MGLRPHLLVAVVAALASAPAATAQDAGCPDADTVLVAGGEARAAAAVRCLVDAERRARGLSTLRNGDLLELAARWHGEDMRDRGFFAHVSPLPAPHGADTGDRLDEAGYDWMSWGENIAVGHRTPTAVMRDWMRSEGHCRNVLAPFAQIGVGVVTGGRPHWVQVFGTAPGMSAGNGAPKAACPAGGLGEGTAPAPAPAADPAATPAEVPVISFNARRAGGRVRISGAVTGAVRRVKVTVRRGERSRVEFASVRSGRFRVALRLPARRGRIQVSVVAAG